ncbi:MAG: hypothetical protein HN509_11215 [Halobacteriovoraceae bacterium]|nr:hypothetical protein [Halobacteriovoraceae bacterium]
MDAVYFIFRYIPFWAVPLFIISCQFFYTYWLKDYRRAAYVFVASGVFSFVFLLYYIWAGSPDNSAGNLENFLRSF